MYTHTYEHFKAFITCTKLSSKKNIPTYPSPELLITTCLIFANYNF